MTKVAWDPELMAGVVIQSVERYGHDRCSPITDYGHGTESMGSTVVIPDWEQTYIAGYAVESDVARLKLPDPLRDGRMPVVIWLAPSHTPFWPGVETSGGRINADIIEQAMARLESRKPRRSAPGLI